MSHLSCQINGPNPVHGGWNEGRLSLSLLSVRPFEPDDLLHLSTPGPPSFCWCPTAEAQAHASSAVPFFFFFFFFFLFSVLPAFINVRPAARLIAVGKFHIFSAMVVVPGGDARLGTVRQSNASFYE